MKMMLRNKYNVRALRQKLEQYVCDGAWNSFRRQIEPLASSRSHQQRRGLLPAIVLFTKSTRFKHSPSLLHLVLYYSARASTHCATALLCHIVRLLVSAVPAALTTVNPHYCQTVLHVAMDRHHPAAVVQVLCQAIMKHCTSINPSISIEDDDHNNNPWRMRDWRGDTPLHVAAQTDGYVQILLHYGGVEQTLLTNTATTATFTTMRNNSTNNNNNDTDGMTKGVVPLWYKVDEELRNLHDERGDNHNHCKLSDELQVLLLATHAALSQQENNNNNIVMHDDDDDKEDMNMNYNDPSVLSAVVSCSILLDRYAVPLLDVLLSTPVCDMSLLLHAICRHETTTLQGATINALLFKRVWTTCLEPFEQERRRTALAQLPDAHGNLPLHGAVSTGKAYTTTVQQANPTALRHGNARGELPLHVALKHKKHAATSCAADAARTDDASAVVVQTLWRADPTTLRVQDGPTGLYPFMLAANQDDPTLSYQLLLAGPEVCMKGCFL